MHFPKISPFLNSSAALPVLRVGGPRGRNLPVLPGVPKFFYRFSILNAIRSDDARKGAELTSTLR